MSEQICVQCVAGFPHPATAICVSNEETIVEEIKKAVATLGRPPKDDEDMTDPLSTGRKRAAKLITDEQLSSMICEWALLKEAGGGARPIKGCHGNKATNRHHGPDKNTLNNERHTNLHAICAFCHNEWHAKNDEFYIEPRPSGETWLPVGDYKLHDPNGPKMTVKQALIQELTRYKDE